jgi:GT2 family glycosyltransferase
MENKKVAIILINYKDYAKRFLVDCLAGIRAQDYLGEIKTFIVDNETSPESFGFLAQTAPEAELILNKNNDGFAKGNNDAMKLALAQGFDFVFCLNMDTIPDKSAVSEMVKVFENNKSGAENEKLRITNYELRPAGAVQARLMLHPETNKINSLGNATHFLGFGYSIGYNDDVKIAKVNEVKTAPICYPSGAAVMFSREALNTVGFFDEEFWMYNEDQDLGWRVWLAGFSCLLANDAVVYHKYEFSRSITKYYWMDRNRIVAILKNYHSLTLLLILPAFLVMEVGLILFSLKSDWWPEKKKVWRYFLTPRTWIYLYRARSESQKIRKVKDRDIISIFTGRIWYQEIDDWKLRMINPVFELYWQLVRMIIFW